MIGYLCTKKISYRNRHARCHHTMLATRNVARNHIRTRLASMDIGQRFVGDPCATRIRPNSLTGELLLEGLILGLALYAVSSVNRRYNSA